MDTNKETTMGTTPDVTDEQIRALRQEALAAGDYRQVDICQRALATDTVDQDGNAIAFADWSREEARAECARVIAEAAAQEDAATVN
jgi:hypothetical protein